MKSGPRFSSAVDARALIMSLGALYLLIAIGTAVIRTSHDESIVAVFVVFCFVGTPGLVLLAGGYRLPRTDISEEFFVVIFGRTVAGIGIMIGILALYHVQPDTGLSEPGRSIPILTGFSAVAGFVAGVSDARAKTRAATLERQNRLLERTQRHLEESNERLEQFAYAASHDLQEPLRMVSSYLHLLDRRYGDDLDEDGEEFLEYALDGSERMTAMVDGLLEFSRIETESEPLRPVDLGDVLAGVRENLELRLEETDATVEIADLPRVEGDPRQLQRLFQNLLSNAIEYSGESPPRIAVTAEPDGEGWLVSVRDEGIGIDPDEQDRVFEVFERLHARDEHAGTGIGLAMCKRIVERHGGEIWVKSAPGEGATFSVTLPGTTDRLESEADGPVR
ncbi:ATP-binding protein [Natrarchaeobius sp. A-rgal3]|uniref:sensor histidine kinase n=1 Tax=Natrarchaeobius versutus TaxID=1679078 RepID=UPI003510D1AD